MVASIRMATVEMKRSDLTRKICRSQTLQECLWEKSSWLIDDFPVLTWETVLQFQIHSWYMILCPEGLLMSYQNSKRLNKICLKSNKSYLSYIIKYNLLTALYDILGIMYICGLRNYKNIDYYFGPYFFLYH